MPLLVYKYSDYDHTAEREQYRALCKQLKGYYGQRDEMCIYVANYNIYDSELDALLIKQDAIISIEYKNYGGEITAVDNGQWTTEDGTIIKGGSRKSVYQQAKVNHIAVKNGFKDGMFLPVKVLREVAALVVFHQPIVLDNQLPLKTQSWLHVCDEDTFMEKVQDITNSKMDLSEEDMLRLVERMNLLEEKLDENYSNKELLEGNDDYGYEEEEEIEEEGGEEKTTQGVGEKMASVNEKMMETVENKIMKDNQPEINRDILPKWLDDYIFDELGAQYCKVSGDMTVIDWNRSEILNYLGTYFPRSYVESNCIYNAHIEQILSQYHDKEELAIFDFGCGTGGEIIGLLDVLRERYSNLKKIKITALDGNSSSLRLLRSIIKKYKQVYSVNIEESLIPVKIDDFYDLSIIDNVIHDKYDIVMSFKAICEFVTKQCLETRNPYEYFLKIFLPKVEIGGGIVLVDVTTHNELLQSWIPNLMDRGLNNIKANVIARNENFNQIFNVTHSRVKNDVSKIAWRIIKK